MSLPQNKKKEYFNMLQGNKEVALVQILEDMFLQMEERMESTNRDSIFADLEPAKTIAKKVANDEISSFKQEVDQKVGDVLKAVKDFQVDVNAEIDDRMNQNLNRAVQQLRETTRTFSGNMAQVQAITAKRINTIATEIENKVGPKGDPGVAGKDGMDGKDGKAGKDGKDGSPDTPDDIIKKISKAESQIPMSKVAGLDQLKVGQSRGSGGSGGGAGNVVTEAFDGDNSTTSFQLASKVASGGKAIMVMYQGQVLETTTHYSVSGKTLSLTFTPESDTVVFVWYLRT